MVKIVKLVHLDHILVISSKPYAHATNHYSLGVGHKLPWSNTKTVQELYEEGMDRKPQPTNEGRLIKAYFPEEEMTCPILLTGQANPNSL